MCHTHTPTPPPTHTSPHPHTHTPTHTMQRMLGAVSWPVAKARRAGGAGLQRPHLTRRTPRPRAPSAHGLGDSSERNFHIKPNLDEKSWFKKKKPVHQ